MHLIPLPTRAEATGAVRTLCGGRLGTAQIEMVTPGEGVPCTLCVLVHLSDRSPEPPPAQPQERPVGTATAGRFAAAADYHAWGWPVTMRRDQIWFALDAHAVALIIPVALAAEVTTILATRRCPAPVLAHPGVTEHRIVLASEPYGVPLPWPPAVHRVTGSLLLPPAVTPSGPLLWVHPPAPDTLHLCREIDIFGALHTLGAVGGGP